MIAPSVLAGRDQSRLEGDDHGLDPVAGGEIVVPLGYVTTQDPAVAPPDVRVPRLCWQISAVVETASGTPRLVEPRPGSQLRTPC